MKVGRNKRGGSEEFDPRDNAVRSREAGAQLKKKTKRSAQFGKRTISIVLSLLVIAGALLTALIIMRSNNDTVQVARFATNVKSGTIITSNLFEAVEMTQEDFNRIGTRTYVDANGNEQTANNLLKYADISKYVGSNNLYAQSYFTDGTLAFTDMFTTEKLIRSEWTKSVEPGYEYYTMDLSELTDVYTPIFFPGSHIRIRMSHEVTYDPTDPDAVRRIENLRSAIAAKERAALSGGYIRGESKILDALYAGDISSAGAGNGFGQSAYQEAGTTITISEVIWDDIIVIDMLNSANESIFDLYLDLLDMPVSTRIKYLETKLNDDGNDLKSQVTPSKIVFVVTREEASDLLEFENLDVELKVTVLETEDHDYDLFKQFTEVGNQVQAMIDNHPTTSFGSN